MIEVVPWWYNDVITVVRETSLFLCHVEWLAHPQLLSKQQGHLTSHHTEMICRRVNIQGFSYMHAHMKMNSIPVSLTPPVSRSSHSAMCHQTLSL